MQLIRLIGSRSVTRLAREHLRESFSEVKMGRSVKKKKAASLKCGTISK